MVVIFGLVLLPYWLVVAPAGTAKQFLEKGASLSGFLTY
jgi:hypothetical protein